MAILFSNTEKIFVEPNHLSAQRTGQIYAQSKFTKNNITGTAGGVSLAMLVDAPYNGLFLKINPETNEVTNDYSVPGEVLLNFSEVKIYDSKLTQTEFSPSFNNYLDGEYYPRLLKTNVGDIYTTNLTLEMMMNVLKKNSYDTGLITSSVVYDEISVGDKLVPTAGILTKKAEPAATDMVWVVKEITTAPNGIDDAVKIVRVQ